MQMKVQELLLRELQLPKGKVLRLLEPLLFQRLSPDIFPGHFLPGHFLPGHFLPGHFLPGQ